MRFSSTLLNLSRHHVLPLLCTLHSVSHFVHPVNYTAHTSFKPIHDCTPHFPYLVLLPVAKSYMLWLLIHTYVYQFSPVSRKSTNENSEISELGNLPNTRQSDIQSFTQLSRPHCKTFLLVLMYNCVAIVV